MGDRKNQMTRRLPPTWFAVPPPRQQMGEPHWRPEHDTVPSPERGEKTLLDQVDTGLIGRSIDLEGVAGFHPNNDVILINLIGDDTKSQIMEVFLTVERTRNDIIVNRDIVAVVSWGAGGHRAPRTEVDLIDGTAFSLACSSLQIFVHSDATAALTHFKVGAFLGFGTRPGGLSLRGPQRTFKFGAIAPAGFVDIPVPNFASSVTVVRTPTNTYSVQYLDGVGVLIAEVPVAAGMDLNGLPLAIPNDTFTIRIKDGGAGLTSGRVIFGLTL
jgi:hypothetical protein